ncbi:MAG: flagellar biosynthetic protein FliO [Eubacteriales bacterium]|nr:flagellar biosynthetic protein FliO [Eubacteriales bacterium]MDD4421737.1 flagellar biosynthetic protein FliO [Eubacteriales bacterium]HBR31055.1 hypothetical protein [Clostridiales bacterium]
MKDFFDILLPLFVVVLVIIAAYLTTRWIAKKQNAYTSGKIITVLERVMLGRDVYIAVVKVDTKIYLMSISSGKVELLSELSSEVMDKYSSDGQSTTDFMKILKSIINKNGNDKQSGRDKKDR